MPATMQSARVLSFRKRQGWTQKKAAEWYGCTERSWQRYESGERSVPRPLLNRINDYEVALTRGSE